MNKVLVTGGLGFIGTHLLIQLLETTDMQVICMDAETYASNKNNIKKYLRNNSQYRRRITLIKKDISNKKHLDAFFQSNAIDYIINVAAESHVDNSITGPAPFVHTNIVGTFNLLECARIYDVKKFVQVSTDEVYGQLKSLSEDAFRETTAIAPSSVYSASKASADVLALSYFKTYKLHVNVTRCCNNYGPYQHAEKLIPKTILNVIGDKRVPVYGDGSNIREWIHATDHCHAIIKVLQNGCAGETYNVGTDNCITNLELVKQIITDLDKSMDLIEFVEDRKGHDYIYRINSAKIASELGWKPQIAFDVGLEQTIEWYKQQ
jgi:dTDP-glucose 4,6-dehydratase